MQVLRSLTALFASPAIAPAAPVAQPLALTAEELALVAGGLPRVGPCKVAEPAVIEYLPKVG